MLVSKREVADQSVNDFLIDEAELVYTWVALTICGCGMSITDKMTDDSDI
jgi:hypothetical protein